MNPEARKKIAYELEAMSVYYSKQLNPQALSMMVSDLEDLPAELVLMAIKKYRQNPKNRTFPLPAQIREIIHPSADDRAVSIELSRKILKALGTHGWSWQHGYYENGKPYFEDDKGNRFETFQQAVVSELGLIGWEIVESRGGWQNLATMANEQEEGIYQAQLRDQIEAAIKNKKSGVDVSKLSLPSPEADAVKALLSGFEFKSP
jgi:hypothetical protein